MTCSACGVANEPGRKFCRECGVRLAALCGSCGAANAADDKFCGECGQPLRREALAAPVAALAREGDAERRVVSVLFVDLVGFTPFSEGRDAEDVRAVLVQYFDAASDAVQRHGGTVEKFIGDAVMAVWGTPVAHEDDAERAVRSALEIVDRVAALGRSLAVDLKARGGVLTGEALAVLDAVGQGLVTGDLVNAASRLQSAADPGTVLVGDKTYRSISASIACLPVPPLTLKGLAEPLQAWQALRVLSEMGGSGRGSAPEPPFGGRDEELRLAKELLHATGREGRPRLVHVNGVAGIGKSRLVWELDKYVDGLTETFLWHQGRCPSYGEGVAFWALAEMVRGRARIADTDDEATARAALGRCLEQYFPEAEERRWIEPRLGQLIGLEGALSGRDELFGAWRRFFERVAEHGTTVLVFEDLHWADPGLLDFVESLLEWSRTSPIIVLSLARPELSDRRANWGAGVRNSTTLHLARLTDSDIETMVTGYVDGLPVDGLARLVSRAEGVPMYAVETVRMLASSGVLEQTGSSYVVVGDLGDELDIPETLHALVAARLDGLPDVERTLVQDASVAGHTFSLANVCAVGGRDAAEVEPLLRTLVRKEVLDQDVDPRSAERGQYRFVQSVIQEVAYSTLSKSARWAKHLASAHWLESLEEDELAGVVASHYLEAYRSEPGAADAEDVADRARGWLMKAGERASSLGSPEQAYSYACLGLTLATSPGSRAGLHALATASARDAGDPEGVWEHLTAASADFQVLGDVVGEAKAMFGVNSLSVPRERAGELLDRRVAAEVRLPAEFVPVRVVLLGDIAVSLAHAGEIAQALDVSERALTLAQTIEDDDDSELPLRDAVNARAFVLHVAGRHLESRLLFEELVAMSRSTGSPAALARALLTFGVGINEDDPRGSLVAMQECAGYAQAGGLRAMQGLALANASESAVDLGEWDVAEAALAEASRLSRGERDDADGAMMTEAMLVAHRADPQSALAMLSEMDARRDQSWDVVLMHTWFLRVQALCRYLGGDAVGAAADAQLSLQLDSAGGNAGPSLWVAVQACSALGDAGGISRALDATAGLRGHWTRMVRMTARAAIAVLAGADGGGASMQAALDAWTSAGLPLDHACATLCSLYLLPPADVSQSDRERARAHLEGLRATSLLRLFDAASSVGG
jgi:class 3 adenylate cyclase